MMLEWFNSLFLIFLGMFLSFFVFSMSKTCIKILLNLRLGFINSNIAECILENNTKDCFEYYIKVRKEFLDVVEYNDRIFKRLRGG